MNVPEHIGNVWVAGKAAGFDPIAHSSARVVPFGMAIGEAVGVAAATGAEERLTPAEVATSRAVVARIRERLEEHGAWLPPLEDRNPVGPFRHPHHSAYRLLLSRGLALGGYANEPGLDDEATALSYVYMLSNVGKRFLQDDALGPALITRFPRSSAALTADAALEITAWTMCRLGDCPAEDWASLQAAGFDPGPLDVRSLSGGQVLKRGEMYELAAAVIRWAGPR